jgi:flagellar hook-length control protein FliK
MNVLLTDVSSPSTVMPKAETASDSGSKGFRSMMQKNLQVEPDNDVQLVENKEINPAINVYAVNPELTIESSLIPDFWMEHLATSETELTTEQSPMAGIGVVEASSFVVKPQLSEIRSTGNRGAIGDTLPVNGNPLPLTIMPSATMQSTIMPSATTQSTITQSTITQSTITQSTITQSTIMPSATMQSTILEQTPSAGPIGLPDQPDQFSAKFLESSALQQTAADSSSARLHAAMSTINGLQNSVANPATANPVASSSVLPNSFERMVMTNPESSAEWSNGIGERVSLMLNQKLNAATIRLDPPMLGKMDIQIQVRDDVTRVTINTQHAQTRDMVDSASYRLREILQDAGYQNVNVDVSHQSDQQKNDAQFMADADADIDTAGASDSEQSTNGDNNALSARMYHPDSLVDYFA